MATLYANRKLPNIGGWQDRHDRAIDDERHNTGPERSIIRMLKAWHLHADMHYVKYGSKVRDDYVLGPCWQQIGEGIRGFLNGDCGRLDCGTLDAFILDTLSENGIDTENL